MMVKQPTVNAPEIERWIRQAAERRQEVVAPVVEEGSPPPPQMLEAALFDFTKARLPLLRARAKSSVRAVKPIRRLLTNQEAINEGLADAVAALIAINKSMAAEIDMLRSHLNRLAGNNGRQSTRS